ncbi:MAG: M3 family oligoendopeptidase [Parachlamydia sp.]|nr:M3 family oligoendopeptidase [Parachlamydia sp.]
MIPNMKYAQKWSLDPIFPGGSRSQKFAQFLEKISEGIVRLNESLEAPESLKEAILHWQEICEQVSEAGSFVACNVAQDVYDSHAEQLQSVISELSAKLGNCVSHIEEKLKEMPDRDFQALMQELPPIAFPLAYRRERAREKLKLEQETLINEVSVDGYHGWSQLYGTLIGQVLIPVGDRKISWGQAYNLLSKPDRELRKEVFASSNRVWKEQQQLYASTLNHVAGFRLKVYERRGWHFLKEPLDHNRMSRETLDAMWSAIEKNKAPFVDYMGMKAKLLGLNKLHWCDIEAPLQGGQETVIPYDKGADFIISCFAEFSPKMGAYAKKAFEQHWIEAEDRGGKRPGGFCTDIPIQKESRIFMTYSNTKESLFTLAHELGHAYHNEVIFKLPELARHFPMNLAETASTFAEMVVTDETLKRERNPAARLALLDGKLQRSVVFLCNIHARYLFDVAFHEERKQGAVSPERLCELMESAQKKGYCEALAEYHPYFWASKMHFHSSGAPFYNFPYTFGFLFSLGVYLRAREKKDEDGYIALLSDTGRMTAEDLAKKHLGVDLRQEAFWQETLDFLKEDVKEFQTLMNW